MDSGIAEEALKGVLINVILKNFPGIPLSIFLGFPIKIHAQNSPMKSSNSFHEDKKSYKNTLFLKHWHITS